MPYIEDQKKRERINKIVEDLTDLTETNGDLNYAITRLFHEETMIRGLCYDTLNSLMGVLECVKSEFYRKVVAPYEEKKRIENGGVSELDAKSLEDVR